MPERLDGIGMKQYLVIPAYAAYFPDRLYGSDLVVRIHYRDKARIFPYRRLKFIGSYKAVLVNIEKCNFVPLFFQAFEAYAGSRDVRMPTR